MVDSVIFFFFKQKTAYEMRISDWSSDVCSSDLTPEAEAWQQALLQFYRDGFRTAARHDGLAYAVGNSPKVPAERIAWLPPEAPHPAYTIQRNLEAMEFQFETLDAVVDILYRGAGDDESGYARHRPRERKESGG